MDLLGSRGGREGGRRRGRGRSLCGSKRHASVRLPLHANQVTHTATQYPLGREDAQMFVCAPCPAV